MPKLTRLELAVIIGTFMVAITINAVWRVRVMGAQERQRVAELEAGTLDGGTDDDAEAPDSSSE